MTDTLKQAQLGGQMKVLLLIEALIFAFAASVHRGWTIAGYEHASAATAEGTVAAILMVGFVLSPAVPTLSRWAGLMAQGLALAGTMIGVFVVIIGVGPQTAPDVICHAVMIVVLAYGIARLMPSAKCAQQLSGDARVVSPRD